jgi:flagellar biosynthesis protein FlhB
MKSTTIETWGDTMMQKWILFFEKETVQSNIKHRILDPILRHIMKQIFPYILLICIMFVLLLISVLITLGVIIFQVRGVEPKITG